MNGSSVLVCMDIASRGRPRAGHALRGLNGSVKSTASGVKRGEGKVTALVTKRDRVLATTIEGSVQRGESLEGLSSRKSDYARSAKRGVRSIGGASICPP